MALPLGTRQLGQGHSGVDIRPVSFKLAKPRVDTSLLASNPSQHKLPCLSRLARWNILELLRAVSLCSEPWPSLCVCSSFSTGCPSCGSHSIHLLTALPELVTSWQEDNHDGQLPRWSWPSYLPVSARHRDGQLRALDGEVTRSRYVILLFGHLLGSCFPLPSGDFQSAEDVILEEDPRQGDPSKRCSPR